MLHGRLGEWLLGELREQGEAGPRLCDEHGPGVASSAGNSETPGGSLTRGRRRVILAALFLPRPARRCEMADPHVVPGVKVGSTKGSTNVPASRGRRVAGRLGVPAITQKPLRPAKQG